MNTDISEEGLKKLWRAVINRAMDDIENGGLPVKGYETANVKLGRQLEAYHWLFSERSDLAFEIQGVYCEEFREQIRTRLKAQGWVLPQGAVTRIRACV